MMATHVFEPAAKYPWFCGRCGYGENERLMHKTTVGQETWPRPTAAVASRKAVLAEPWDKLTEDEGKAPSPSPWPLMGYAPGKYRISACSGCGDSFDGDKYSWHCLPCAVRAANAEMERLRGERTLAAMSAKERAGIMREIAAAVGTGGVSL